MLPMDGSLRLDLNQAGPESSACLPSRPHMLGHCFCPPLALQADHLPASRPHMHAATVSARLTPCRLDFCEALLSAATAYGIAGCWQW